MHSDGLKTRKKYFYVLCFFAAVLAAGFSAGRAGADINMTDGIGMGIPFGGKISESELDICPQGVSVVRMFLNAWKTEDYKTMYELIDDSSKVDYPFERARIDLQFLKYEPYEISSVRKAGDNFEFILSTGDWKMGDKDVKKMIISGSTFKIIMPTKNSPFKRSLDSYF